MLRLREDVRVERLDDEIAVLDPRSDSVHRLAGPAVAAIDLLEAGVEADDVPEDLIPALDELAAAGLLEDGRAWTRRRFMKLAAAGGAAWTAATVTSFALADPAAAATMCMSGWVPTAPGQMYTSNNTFRTGPAGVNMSNMYNLTVRVWGAGGGGGGGGNTNVGGGGGGGGYRGGSIAVTECTAYTITVGTGGNAGSGSGGGSLGGQSMFGSLVTAGGGLGGGSGNGAGGGAGGSAGSGSGSGWAGGTGGMSGGTTWLNNGSGGGGGGAGGHGAMGSNGAAGNDSNSRPAGGMGGGNPAGGTGGRGGNDDNSPETGAAPGGGGGGAEESTLNSSGAMGANGAVWVGV